MSKELIKQKILNVLEAYRKAYQLAPSMLPGDEVDIAQLQILNKEIDKATIREITKIFEEQS